MIRDFSNSAKKKLLEYVKDATETTLWRKIGDRIGDAGLQIQYWFGALSISKYIDNLDAYHKKIIDKNNTTSQRIEEIFTNVKNIDTRYQGGLQQNNPCLFLRNPNVDFSRKRKIDFKTFIGIMMNSGGATMSKELLDFFDFNKNTPSVSAFTQQRSKVLPEAFEYLFKSFTDDNLPTTNNYHGYRLIACDGSNLTIATNQKDPETFWERNQYGSIVNKLHLNAFYDVLNRIYTDVLVQTAADYNEFRACATMIDRSKLENVILVADRGYENYNIFAHAIEKGWKFAIRVKDKNSNGIASGLNFPPNDEFDIDITQIFSRENTKTTKNADYKWMPVNQVFDYLPRKSDKTYELSFEMAHYADIGIILHREKYIRATRSTSSFDLISLLVASIIGCSVMP